VQPGEGESLVNDDGGKEKAATVGLLDGASTATLSSPARLSVKISVVRGSLTRVPSQVAIVSRYKGIGPAGPAKDFDQLLDSWLTRVIDLGMVGAELGQISLLPLKDLQRDGSIQTANLIVAGMGEPGMFAADDLRFLISNIFVAVSALGYQRISLPLIGSRRQELPRDRAARATIEGIVDGNALFLAMLEGAVTKKQRDYQPTDRSLELLLVDEGDETSVGQTFRAIEAASQVVTSDLVKLVVSPDIAQGSWDKQHSVPAADADPDVPLTMLRITKKAVATSEAQAAQDTETFEFSALGDQAVVTVREQEVSTCFLRDLPGRIAAAKSLDEAERLGAFFVNCVIPDDFRRFIESAGQLTIEVDARTAAYPWEMAAFKNHSRTGCFGTDLNLSRRFYSVNSSAPGAHPPIDRKLRILIIADPAAGRLALPQAREEGFAVVVALREAQQAWGGRYELQAWIRIGSHRDPDSVEEHLEQARRQQDIVCSADTCDPIELAMLITSESFDVIHYAGHGVFDAAHDRAGWLFDEDCLLSAKEIFRVRQVPRLVFANACFSSATDRDDQRRHVVGFAQAFFARGIQNYIGAAWTVDDRLAASFAKTFYRRVLGLSATGKQTGASGTAPPATLGQALADARVSIRSDGSTTWGAYQHYGNANDKLLSFPNRDLDLLKKRSITWSAPTPAIADPPTRPSWDPDKVYINGINPETGAYAVAPVSLDKMSKSIYAHPGGEKLPHNRGSHLRFAPPYDVKLEDVAQAGWGIVFAVDTPAFIREALEPLIAHRRGLVGGLFKQLEYRKGEQLPDWYRRNNISVGTLDQEVVPYYLLLVGSPEAIPFEFQYLLGVEYAVGRLALDSAKDYACYANSVVEYEKAVNVNNSKKIVYWGTCHPNDAATNLSSSQLVAPLAEGLPGSTGAYSKPLHEQVRFASQFFHEETATKQALVAQFTAGVAPAVVFTASHGMAIPVGNRLQLTDQGGLLTQDWPGFGRVRPEHYVTAADIPDSANVRGLVAVFFACFSAGTPDRDQFLMDLSELAEAESIAAKPFTAALPRRLLSHPNGTALAVVGHIDRAWAFSIQPSNSPTSHIGPFRNGLGAILTGLPLGHVISQQFGQRYAALSAILLSAVSPTSPDSKLSDRQLVTSWLERNDAQNYVLLGDPAVSIRVNAMSDAVPSE
jgi:hypothetical protein